MIGQTISHYKILEKLGEGGMGVVYKAHDTELDRDVALKFLSRHLVADDSDKKRFIQEAKSAAILNHPNICTIHGIEEASDPVTGESQTFIVMEYVDGKTLKDVQATLSHKQSLAIAEQIAKGLSAAHEHGVVHRDIKPENIMVRRDGIVVIMDFGLARLRGGSKFTQAGSTSGTAGYMAPEQVLGQDCDHRADIFSLGIVLYELFSGHSPFKGVHAAALTYEIVNVDTPPISSIKSDINPELDALVSECLAKDPNERIQSAAEVRRKLGVITGETRSHTKSSAHHTAPQSEHSAQASRGFFLAGKKWLLAAIGLLALSFAVLAVIHFAEPENLDLSKYQFTPIASDAEPQTEPAWSPDGKGITYTKKVDGIFQVFIRNLDSPLPSKLTNLVSNAETPFWSHDGNLVYFISNRNLCSIGLAGGEHRKLLRSVYAATISPDGKAIAYWSFQNGTSSVYIALVNDTTGRKYEPAPFEIGGSWYPNYIQFSPDGKRIGLSTYRSGGRGAQFWILPWPDGEGAKPFKAFEGALFQDPVSFAWMPDSRHILLSNRKKLWIGEAETGKMRQVFPLIDEGIRHISVSPDGTRIVATVQRENYNIIQLPLDGSQPRNVMASSRDEKSMSWSRAGDKAIYITDRSGEDEIWLAINGTDIRPIITKKDFPNAEHPRIVAATMSPDGSRIAFSFSQKEFGGRTFITSTDGGKPTRVFSGETDEQNCAWSSDGKYLAAYVTEKGALKLGVALVGSQEPPRFIADVDSLRGWLNWSPDNKWIASGLRHDIVLISPDGKSRKIIASPEIGASDEYLLVWSKDGATIYVACSRGRGARLHAVDVKTGRSRKIAEYGDEIVFSAQWFYELFGCLAPDGKSIVTTVVDYKSDIWMLEGLPQK